MKALHVNDHRWALGGVERYLSRLAVALDSAGEPRMALAYGHPAPPDAPALPLDHDGHVPELSPPRAHDPRRAASALLDLVVQVGADAVYFHNYLDERVIARVAASLPVVKMVHLHNEYCPTGSKFLRRDAAACPR